MELLVIYTLLFICAAMWLMGSISAILYGIELFKSRDPYKHKLAMILWCMGMSSILVGATVLLGRV